METTGKYWPWSLFSHCWERRYGAAAPRGPLQVWRRGPDKIIDKRQALVIIDRVALTPQHSLHVVRSALVNG